MTNNAAGLNAYLATQLRDTAYAVWTTGEMDNLIAWAVDNLYPQFPRPIDSTTTTITLVTDTYFYALPTGVRDVRAIEMYNGTDEYGYIDGTSWEVVGDIYLGTAKIHISPVLTQNFNAYTIRVHGYGVYDVTTHLIPDDLVPLVLSMARAEAYRRMGADMAQYQNWANRAQRDNVSMSELLGLIHEAESEVQLLKSRLGRGQRRPVPARQ